MVKTVEQALKVNILQISKAALRTHSTILKLEWVCGVSCYTGVAMLTEDMVTVLVGGQLLHASVGRREFQKGRYQPHMQCLACGKHCHILYIDGGHLKCRRCAGLIYESQLGRAPERAFLKAQKIIDQLKGKPGEVIPIKPAGMWRSTYRRQVQQLTQAYQCWYSRSRIGQ
jgi:hypothetical protein